ncbi:hypothetical protein [Scale drop disease virus]|uniref:ORF_022L n=1 Tax=Scale drop disease virus TaxID=1697349 RepID=A0A0K1L648_9VIRU|nr:ORF_022L [Scale drop disease virus]AKU37437.1 ORF_022L [Scale drop disease virus]QLI60694.1 hypothetical protein [Scale drop disease virus]QXJ13612.1 ORF022L [Scale drop disease virus]UNH60761.1 hypothetical protein SDDV_ORF092 [Scale drop disease virus]
MTIIVISGSKPEEHVTLPLLPSHIDKRVSIKLLALTFNNATVSNTLADITFDNVSLENTVVRQNGRAVTFIAINERTRTFLPLSDNHCVYSTRLPQVVHVTLGPQNIIAQWKDNTTWIMFLEINNL